MDSDNDDFELFIFFVLLLRYKKDQDIALLATSSLHNLLNASLLSETGPPLLDFEVMYTLFCYCCLLSNILPPLHLLKILLCSSFFTCQVTIDFSASLKIILYSDTVT